MAKLPDGVNIHDLINDLRLFSWEAADVLLGYSRILRDSNFKSNILKNGNIEDPVTIADLKVNKLIIQRINKKYKDVNWGMLSEENEKISKTNFTNFSKWMWVFDPLDGTKDFIQGTGNYAMHLALNYQKKPYLGIVLIPEKNELWISNGYKTWCENRNGTKIKHHLSANKTLLNMTLVTSKNHNNETLRNLIQKIGFSKVIKMGSIGCKIASITRGESDIYIGLSLPRKSSPKDWDFSAPDAILKSSGGVITNLDNEELSYGKSNYEQRGIIIASNNKRNHKDICLEIRKVIEKYRIYQV